MVSNSLDNQFISYKEFKNKIVSITDLSPSDVDFSRIINELSNKKYITYPNGSTKNVSVTEALEAANRNRSSISTNNQSDVVELANRLINQFERTASTAYVSSDVDEPPMAPVLSRQDTTVLAWGDDGDEPPMAPVLSRQDATVLAWGDDGGSIGNSIVGGKKKRKLMKKKTKSKRKLNNKKSMRKSKKNINKKKKSKKNGFARKTRKHN